MLRLPRFEYHHATSLGDALALLAQHRGDARVIAGGTDLVPNMKHGLQGAAHLVGLGGLRELDFIREEAGGALAIGALTPLQRIADSSVVRARAPSLAEACGQVAGPQLRRMGTLGGNVCLDTRCVWYNQTYFWRRALGYCLKKDGTLCHVVAGGRRCVAAASNDSAPVLISLGARVTLASPAGTREVAMAEFYVADGITNTVRGEDEVLTHVWIPAPAAGLRTAFEKLRIRKAIDFPILNVAAAVDVGGDGTVRDIALVVSALAARPAQVKGARAAVGRRLDDATIAAVAERAHKQCHPLTNINVDPDWRREMVPVLTRRALRRIAAAGPP
jgi:4-hydroxybenzoyl-CoA reductase subunit beta